MKLVVFVGPEVQRILVVHSGVVRQEVPLFLVVRFVVHPVDVVGREVGGCRGTGDPANPRRVVRHASRERRTLGSSALHLVVQVHRKAAGCHGARGPARPRRAAQTRVISGRHDMKDLAGRAAGGHSRMGGLGRRAACVARVRQLVEFVRREVQLVVDIGQHVVGI